MEIEKLPIEHFAFRVMRENGWQVSPPRADGGQTATRDVASVTYQRAFTFTVEAPAEGDWTVTATEHGEIVARQSGPCDEVTGAAISYAHLIAAT